MKAKELKAQLKDVNDEVEIRVGMFYGPGAPLLEGYPVEYTLGPGDDQPVFIICASDYSRSPKKG